MKPRQVFFSVFLMGALLMLPVQTQAQTVTNETAYRALLLELIELLQQQIIVLQAELTTQQSPEERIETPAKSISGYVSTEEKYDIDRPSEVSRISNREHREYFTRVFELFPYEFDEKIRRLEVFDGGDILFDAYVETLPPMHEYWKYAVNGEIIKDEDSDSNTELIVHELAHIVSYEEVPGVWAPVQSTCEDYFDIHGCPAENSYLGQFVNTFWSASDLRRAERFAEDDDPFEAAYDYYEQNEDDYVTDYAASSPEEDFSDSFTFFALEEPTKRGTLARQKVDWFNKYPTMFSLKEEIEENK